MKRIFLIVVFIMIFVLFCNSKIEAADSTASMKGFETTNLNHLGNDAAVEDQRIYGSSFYYGNVSMWASVYDLYVKENNNSITKYYFVFIESSIVSRGKTKIGWINNYFRNQRLTINVDFYTNEACTLDCYTEGSVNGSTSFSKSYSGAISGELAFSSNGVGGSIGGEAGIAFSYGQTYDNVTLTNSKSSSSDKCEHHFTFTYDFLKYKDGKMVSPNTGLVTEKMALIYSIQNCDNDESMNIRIKTTAKIFKDVTAGVDSSSTGSITLSGNDNDGLYID